MSSTQPMSTLITTPAPTPQATIGASSTSIVTKSPGVSSRKRSQATPAKSKKSTRSLKLFVTVKQKTEASESVFTVSNILAILALILAVLGLWAAWAGTNTSNAIATKEHILNCRNYYASSSNAPIPPECAAEMTDLIPVTSSVAISTQLSHEAARIKRWWTWPTEWKADRPSMHVTYDQPAGSNDHWKVPDDIIARCFNETAMVAPVYWDEAQDEYSYWLESDKKCLTHIVQPGDPTKNWKHIDQYFDVEEGFSAFFSRRFSDEDLPHPTSCVNCGCLPHFYFFRCRDCMDECNWVEAVNSRKANGYDEYSSNQPLSAANQFFFFRSPHMRKDFVSGKYIDLAEED